MRKMKPKRNQKPGPLDNCYTPCEALEPIIPLIPTGATVWEPAAGEHGITNCLRDAGCQVVESDIRTGQDFFEYQPPKFDCIVTNPPFSLKYAWLERCYDLKVPFALLLPYDTLATASGQSQFSRGEVNMIVFNRRINFIMNREIKSKKSACPFPTAWFCHGMKLPRQINFHNLGEKHGEIERVSVSGEAASIGNARYSVAWVKGDSL